MPPRFALFLALLSSAAPLPQAAQAQPRAAAPAQSAADRAFTRLSERWLAESLRLNPVTATLAGEHRHDALMPDISAAGRAQALQLAQATLAQLGRVRRSALSRPLQVDAAILENQLKRDIFNLERLQSWAWDPTDYTGTAGSALYGLMAREFAPLPDRLRAATRRMEALPALLAETRRQLVPARVPKIYAETAVRQNAGISGVIDSIAAAGGALPAADRARLEQAAASAKAAVAEHGRWLETSLVPAATGDFRIGAALYDEKLALALNSPLPRAEIRRRAETVIAQTRREMYGIARRVLQGRAGAPPAPEAPTDAQQQAVIAAALDLAAADRTPRDQLVPFARQAMAQATAFVRAHNLVTIPAGADFAIVEMPEYQQGVAVAYADSPGPLDRSERAFYAVAGVPRSWTDVQVESFLREYNKRAVQELTIHEAMPGHLLQFAHGNAYPSTLRAFLTSGTMVEGWAMYAEDVMREAGYLDRDPLYQLVHLKWRLRATLNAIIDQMIHVDGASRDQVMDLLTRVAFQEEREAAGKWVRAQLSSAQLPTYFVGYSEWRDLRAAAERRPGFDLKRFHDQALSYGAPPVRFIRQLMLNEPVR
jgi:uncharacterized protein (DUF885 family)